MVVILPYCIKAKRCEHNALGYWSGLALCLTKVRSSRARCPATALIMTLHSHFICLPLIIIVQVNLNWCECSGHIFSINKFRVRDFRTFKGSMVTDW